jgi:hypothetical protein
VGDFDPATGGGFSSGHPGLLSACQKPANEFRPSINLLHVYSEKIQMCCKIFVSEKRKIIVKYLSMA